MIEPAIGSPESAIETPALVVNLDAFERNLDRMDAALRGRKVRLRPHAKTHKCPAVALRQLARGAVGVCCQTVGEAEAMIAGGVPDVLITNQVVSPGKIARLVDLALRATVAVCADSAGNVRELSAGAANRGVTLPVLVEVDIGQGRCGVKPGEATLELAGLVASLPGLRFAGVHAYHGGAQHVYDEAERLAVMHAAIEKTRGTVALLKESGLACEIVTGAGTGTFPIEAASDVYTEIQAGSYVFMDADYGRVGGLGFEPSLFLLSTVLSARDDGHAVCDAGLKASSIDSGLPVVVDPPGVRYLAASDEHGTLASETPLKVGQRLRLIPGHCDPTVNLHDRLIAVREGSVEEVWPITARGASA